MNVLQVVTDPDRRGAQVFAVDLGSALVDLGHDVDTVALAPGTHSAPLDLAHLGPTRLGAATLRALRAQARGAEVVVAHGSSTLPACALALTGSGVPFVYRQISDSLFWAPTALRRARVRLELGRARRVVALAEQPAAVLVEHFGVRRDHLDIIPNGVPAGPYAPAGPDARRAARAALGVPAEATVVLSISALAPEKGVDLVIDAVADLDDPDVALLVVGDGPERSALAASAGRRLGERARVTGPLDDAAAAYAAADIVVLASRGGDSMPATLIEASFAGCALVATPVGSITEIVVDGETGVVVPVGDAGALRGAVGRLVDAPVDRARLGSQARRRALERFEIAAVARSWEATLRAAVEG